MERPAATSMSLLERASARDEAAWQRLIALYRPLVVHWCRRGSLPDSEIDDVVQETLIAIASGLPGFRRQRDGSFRSWVRGITGHKILDRQRLRARGPVGEGGTEAHILIERAEDQDNAPGADDDEEAAWLYRRAVELVRAEFTDRTWQAFWLAAVEGRPTDLVADELGMSAVAVRIAKSRVVGRLRQEVGDLLD